VDVIVSFSVVEVNQEGQYPVMPFNRDMVDELVAAGLQPPEQRLAVARRIVERAESLGIPPQDILVDCLALTVGAESQAGLVTLNAIRMVRAELGRNLTGELQHQENVRGPADARTSLGLRYRLLPNLALEATGRDTFQGVPFPD
jgi:hypothetical protein